jgi:hypothetical protein
VSVSRIPLSKNIFWSNPKGSLPLERVIASIVSSGSIDDLSAIRYRYGDNKIKEVILRDLDLSDPKIRLAADFVGL